VPNIYYYHPRNKPGFQSLNSKIQFEEQQLFEKQNFDNQNDEKSRNELNKQYTQARARATSRLEMIDELHSMFANLSQLVYEIFHPTQVESESEQSETEL
jgi:hypothetical protein